MISNGRPSDGPFYLQNLLQVDLDRDVLCRVGPVRGVREEEGDVVCTAPLLRQRHQEDPRFFENGERVGDLFIRFRLYTHGIVRMQVTREPASFDDDTPMLAMDDELQRSEARLHQEDDSYQLDDDSGTRIHVPAGGFAPVIRPDARTNVSFQGRDWFFTGYYDALPLLWLERADGSVRMGFALTIDGNEHFCGGGERFERIDLFGRRFDLVNENGHGCNTPRTYKNIPFLLSSRPYGVFAHSHAKMQLDIGAHSSRSLQWFVEEDRLDLFFIGGARFQDIVQSYQRLTGFPQMPPRWSFGAWMSRCTYRSDEEVTGIARRLREEGYPMDVLHLDTGWFREEWRCDWQFSHERFPDPADFFRRMRDLGFHVTLWEYPYVSPELELHQEVAARGLIGRVTNPSNRVEWGDTLDFSNAEAVDWYKDQLQRLIRLGAAAFKTDFGENIDETAVYRNVGGEKLRNLFSLLYQQATHEATEAAGLEAVQWARSGWAGSQRYPIHWSADCSSTFDGVTHSLWGGLHIGLSGFAFWSHDIGGFYTIGDFMNVKPDQDLYVRWTQHGVFTSHMRFHGMTPREPWEYPGVAGILRQWLRLRYALIPYIENAARTSCHSGLPVLRALVFEWPHDPAAWAISDEYLFGDAFLVCPVFNELGKRDVYLPEGRWVDFWSGEIFDGSRLLRGVAVPLSRMPIYVRAGTTVEYAEPVQHTGELDEAPRFSITYDDAYNGYDTSRLKQHVDV